MIVTISGPPGSGKTTVCNLLASKLELEAIVFGFLFRKLAEEKGISLAELGEIAENDPSIDESIDSQIIKIAKEKDNIILESRLSAYLLSRNEIKAFKVHLSASQEIRMRRIGLRDGESEEDALRNTAERQRSEAARYMKYYGIDINDMSVYDLIVDTDDLTAEQVASWIEKRVRDWNGIRRNYAHNSIYEL